MTPYNEMPYDLGNSAPQATGPSFMQRFASNYFGGQPAQGGSFMDRFGSNYLGMSRSKPVRNFNQGINLSSFGYGGFGTPQPARYYSLDSTMYPPQAPTWNAAPYFRPIGFGQY